MYICHRVRRLPSSPPPNGDGLENSLVDAFLLSPCGNEHGVIPLPSCHRGYEALSSLPPVECS